MFGNVVESSFSVGSARKYRPAISGVVFCLMIVLGVGLYVRDANAVGPLPIPKSTVDYIMTHAIKDIELPRPAIKQTGPKLENNNGPSGPPHTPPTEIGPERPEVSPKIDEVPGTVDGDPGPFTSPKGDPPAPPPPPPVEIPKEPVRVGGLVQPPLKIRDVKPVYPAIAQSARVQGMVIIEATIDALGRVQDAKILRSIPLLDAVALDAVRQWTFTRPTLNGKPQAVIMTVTVNFTLQ